MRAGPPASLPVVGIKSPPRRTRDPRTLHGAARRTAHSRACDAKPVASPLLHRICSMNAPIRIISVVRHPVGGIRTYLKYTYGALPRGKYDFTLIAARSLETAQLMRDLDAPHVRLIEVT